MLLKLLDPLLGSVSESSLRKRFQNTSLRDVVREVLSRTGNGGGSWSCRAGTKASCDGRGCMRELVMVGLTCGEEMGVLTEVL